jgi:2-hydroxymuconate-semialdehyde hydrolase
MSDWEDKYIEVDGVKTHYIEAGQGETIVLFHGALLWACGEMNYGPIMKPLGKHFRVIAPDLVGFGLTPGRGPQDYPGYAQGNFLIKFLETMGIKEAHIGGNSHGGFLSQYVAHERPNLVKSLTIINSLNGTKPIPPLPEGESYTYGAKGHFYPDPPTLETTKEFMNKFYIQKKFVTNERIKRGFELSIMNHEFARARMSKTNSTVESSNKNLEYKDQHISEHAHKLKIPILLTWSKENKGSDTYDAVEYFSKLKEAELHVFRDAGHHVMVEQSERWAGIVKDFIENH